MGGLVGILLKLFIVCVLIYVVKVVIDQLPLPEPIKTVALLIFGLVALVAILSLFGLTAGIGVGAW